jgi:AcrR family transcriptional regulator
MPPRLDPRVERTREAVLEAATMLLRSEGPGAVTHVRVAEAAGVGRATVYRHWPEQGDLLHDAVARKGADLTVPPPELPAHERLALVLEELRTRLNDADAAVQFATLIAHATWDPTLRRALTQLSARGRSVIDGVLRDAIAHGELSAGTDVEVARDGVIGAFLFRRFLTDRRVDRAYLERVIDHALGRASAGAVRRRRAR